MDDDYDEVRQPHRLGFWLLPFNKAAAALVSGHPWNLERYVFDKDTSGFWIDFSNPDKQEYTVGCSDSVDIYLPQVWNSTGSSGISELHASFRAVTDTGPVLLRDESEYSSTEPFSHGSRSYTINFRRDNQRSVLVAQGINSLVAFGHGRFYQFELRWESDGLDEFRMEPPVLYALGPSRVKTKRYVLGKRVGGGTFGNVYRALDMTMGSVMAVKKFHRLSGKRLDFASREITNLLKLNGDESNRCEHIIQLLSYVTTPSDGSVEIFLPLKAGNLKHLITKILSPSSHFDISNLVLNQMLLALHHLDQQGIIHRDVNPKNILFEHSPVTGTYHFTLTDFGLSTTSGSSNSPKFSRVEVAGTTPFMAPELYSRHLYSRHYHKRPHAQTTKIDIWSLFATIVWIRDAKFRKGCDLLGPHLVHVWLNRIAGRGDEYKPIRRMACFDSARRPSAGEQLEILEVETEMEELEELERLEEMREMEEIEARFAGMGIGWNEGIRIEGEWLDGNDLEMQYYRREAYMKSAAGDYGWDGTYDAWSGEGYVLPMQVPPEQEGWMQEYDGYYELVKNPPEEANAALAKWKAWYLAPEKEVVRKGHR